jgi:hypothetical protein
MISEIRKHIKDSIQACSKLYKQIDTPFHKDEDTIGSDPEYKYALVFGSSNKLIDDEDGSTVEIPVNLKTYRQGTRDKLSSFDEGYSQALMIKDLILDRSSLNGKEYIKGMSSSNITPAEVIDSQDIYSYETNLIFTISYGIGE